MKKLATLLTLAFALSLTVVGCAKTGDTKDDAEVTEREIEPATSGGMQRMEEEEEAALPADEAPAEPAESVEDEPAPE